MFVESKSSIIYDYLHIIYIIIYLPTYLYRCYLGTSKLYYHII